MSDDQKNDPAPDPSEVAPADLEPVSGGCFADPETGLPLDPGPYSPNGPFDPTGPVEPGPIKILPWFPKRDFPAGGTGGEGF